MSIKKPICFSNNLLCQVATKDTYMSNLFGMQMLIQSMGMSCCSMYKVSDVSG